MANTPPHLFVGSDRKVEAQSRAIMPGGRVAGSSGAGWAGMVHAVPQGIFTALCGHEVRHIFEDAEWPAGMAESTCPECTRLAAT